jgi:hypothetical protein
VGLASTFGTCEYFRDLRVLSGRAGVFCLPGAKLFAKHPLEPFRLLPHEQNDASAPPPPCAALPAAIPLRLQIRAPCARRPAHSTPEDQLTLRPKTSSLCDPRARGPLPAPPVG